jgi:hypothetical protein
MVAPIAGVADTQELDSVGETKEEVMGNLQLCSPELEIEGRRWNLEVNSRSRFGAGRRSGFRREAARRRRRRSRE